MLVIYIYLSVSSLIQNLMLYFFIFWSENLMLNLLENRVKIRGLVLENVKITTARG